MSLSFKPVTMMCMGCSKRGPHCVMWGENRNPVVFVASDQNFPATLFSRDEESCIAILRIEDGTTKERSFALRSCWRGLHCRRGAWCSLAPCLG
jgi:hypothetical protein